MTKTEYYEKIEKSILDTMSKLDETVSLLNAKHIENHKDVSVLLKAKASLKKVLNDKFDRGARN